MFILVASIRSDTIFLSAVLRALSYITTFSRTTTWHDQLIRIITTKTHWIVDVLSMFLSKTCLILQNESTALLTSEPISDQTCLVFSFLFILLTDMLCIMPLNICENNCGKFLWWRLSFAKECVLCVPSAWLGNSLLYGALYCCLEQA